MRPEAAQVVVAHVEIQAAGRAQFEQLVLEAAQLSEARAAGAHGQAEVAREVAVPAHAHRAATR